MTTADEDRPAVAVQQKQTGAAGIELEVCAASDAGLVRSVNEDRFVIGDLDRGERLDAVSVVRRDLGRRGLLLVVCDGMGGVAGGEVASRIAADAVWEEMAASPATEEVAVFARHLRRAVRTANQRVFARGRRRDLRGMGTTLSAAGLAGRVLVLAQVGDSRAYIQRGTGLSQITRDQSVVAALLRAGRMSPREAERSVQRNMILQALGSGDDVEVAMSIAELCRGDRVLMCSDGLHATVEAEKMANTLVDHDDVGRAVAALVAAAHEAGAPDNVTAILARFDGERLPAPTGSLLVPFTELDPREEGEAALSRTSRVARRLAARAGIGEEPTGPVVPATGQHPVVGNASAPARQRRRGQDRRDASAAASGPATAALASGARLGPIPWLVAIAVALGLVALLLWGGL